MRNNLFYIFCILFIPTIAYSQNVGIGTDKPVKSALLDLNSTDKGFLLPRLTEKQKALIKTPAEGLMIYQTNNSPGVYLFQSGSWKNMGLAGIPNSSATSNLGTTYRANYLLAGDGSTTPVSSGIYTNPSNNSITVGSPLTIQGPFPYFQWNDQNGNRLGYFQHDLSNIVLNNDKGDIILSNSTGEKFRISASGKIGINKNNPQFSLDIVGNARFSSDVQVGSPLTIQGLFPYFQWKDQNGNRLGYFQHDLSNIVLNNDKGDIILSNSTGEKFRISASGKIGINKSNPEFNIDIAGNARFSSDVQVGSPLTIQANNPYIQWKDINGKRLAYIQHDQKDIGFSNDIGGISFSNSKNQFVLTGEGNFGLGKINPVEKVEILGSVKIDTKSTGYLAIGDFSTQSPMTMPQGYRLVVQDGIITEKVKVAIRNQSDWADYVFEENYELMPLNELEDYIKVNNHLPNVPSAIEMVEKGVEVGKTSKMFMEKIEELTLYMIKLNKEIVALKVENETLKKVKIKQ